MEITKIKIGSNVYDVKDANAVGSSDVTKLINTEIYGSETKPSGATVVTSQNITTIAQGAGFTTGDNDTKNTTGASNTSSKIYLVGATVQGANPVTYSNDKCYAEGGYLYTNGAKATTASDVNGAINTELYGSTSKPSGAYVITSQNLASAAQGAGITTVDTDTKNTAGTTNSTSTKLFLVGAPSQGANPQTYSNATCYIGTDNSLYTNGAKAANAQDVTNAINTELYGSANKPSGAYAITSQNLANAASAAGIGSGSGSGVSAYYQLGYTVTRVNGSGALTIPGTDPIYLVSVSDNISSVALTTNPPYGHSCHIIFKSANNASHTVMIAHDNTNRICPEGTGVSLTVPASGYVEIDLLNMGNSSVGNEVYVRGI